MDALNGLQQALESMQDGFFGTHQRPTNIPGVVGKRDKHFSVRRVRFITHNLPNE